MTCCAPLVPLRRVQAALAALRALNNNPSVFTAVRRPIVMFAWENVQALKTRRERQQRAEVLLPIPCLQLTNCEGQAGTPERSKARRQGCTRQADPRSAGRQGRGGHSSRQASAAEAQRCRTVRACADSRCQAEEQAAGAAKVPKKAEPATPQPATPATRKPQPSSNGRRKPKQQHGKIGRQSGPAPDPVRQLLSGKPGATARAAPAAGKVKKAEKKKQPASEDKFDSLVSKYRKQIASAAGTARWFDS